MWRILLGAVLLALTLPPHTAAAQDECPGGATTPEETASVLFGDYLASGQWDMAYDILHPAAQLRYGSAGFAMSRMVNAAFTPLVDVEVFPARVMPVWTWTFNGARFSGVAEVPVRFVRGTMMGTVPSLEIVPLVKVGDCWRWLPPR
jgi:hypothetical protein